MTSTPATSATSPLLSIITVNLNDRDGLAATLASIARQTFGDREVIVVDGGSTDGSQEVIRANAAVVTAWISERDRGTYDAQNKGIVRSRGTYCLFLNAGDTLASDDALARLLAGPPSEDLVYGDIVYAHPDGRRQLHRFPDRPTLELMMRETLPHPATAIRRTLFERIGLYDPELKVVSDYELFLEAVVVRGVSTRHVPVVVALHDATGISWRGGAIVGRERRLVQERTLSPVLLAHWEHHARVTRSRLDRIRDPFRPVAKRLRSWSRRLRGKPDPVD